MHVNFPNWLPQRKKNPLREIAVEIHRRGHDGGVRVQIPEFQVEPEDSVVFAIDQKSLRKPIAVIVPRVDVVLRPFVLEVCEKSLALGCWFLRLGITLANVYPQKVLVVLFLSKDI